MAGSFTIRQPKTDRMAARRKSDRHHDELYPSESEKRAASGPPEVMRKEKPETSGACTKLRRSSVACYARLSSRRWSSDGRLRELADREDDTENKGRINCNLENAATFFFRPD